MDSEIMEFIIIFLIAGSIAVFIAICLLFLITIYSKIWDYKSKNNYYSRKYRSSIAEKWLNYNLSLKDVYIIIEYISQSDTSKPWTYNDKFTEDHFSYLFNLICLNKDKDRFVLLNRIKNTLYSKCVSEELVKNLNFKQEVVMKTIYNLPLYH